MEGRPGGGAAGQEASAKEWTAPADVPVWQVSSSLEDSLNIQAVQDRVPRSELHLPLSPGPQGGVT